MPIYEIHTKFKSQEFCKLCSPLLWMSCKTTKSHGMIFISALLLDLYMITHAKHKSLIVKYWGADIIPFPSLRNPCLLRALRNKIPRNLLNLIIVPKGRVSLKPRVRPMTLSCSSKQLMNEVMRHSPICKLAFWLRADRKTWKSALMICTLHSRDQDFDHIQDLQASLSVC